LVPRAELSARLCDWISTPDPDGAMALASASRQRPWRVVSSGRRKTAARAAVGPKLLLLPARFSAAIPKRPIMRPAAVWSRKWSRPRRWTAVRPRSSVCSRASASRSVTAGFAKLARRMSTALRSTPSKRRRSNLGWMPSRSCCRRTTYLLAESQALPAIVVVRLANGVTHFVVAWQRHGPVVQLMDPCTSRRWISVKRFFGEI